jgi:iron complex transport system substrate-binding protein
MTDSWSRAVAAVAFALAVAGGAARASPRVLSLDQCADQYVLALSPREAIVGLSPRVGDRDSYLRALAQRLPRRRASSEAALAAAPQVVVRYWGGDPGLARTLERQGVHVVRIEEASDFDGVRANIRRVAAALDARARGEALIANMDAQLRGAHGAGGRREALYLTPSGFTAGPGTLIDAVLRAAGYRNAAHGAAYAPVSLEKLLIKPPSALVLGFFDAYGVAQQQWGVGRHPLLRRLADERAVATLPASVLGCPAWFAGDAVQALGAAKRRG